MNEIVIVRRAGSNERARAVLVNPSMDLMKTDLVLCKLLCAMSIQNDLFIVLE